MSKITGSSLNRKMKQITDILQSNGKFCIKKEQIFDSEESLEQQPEIPKQVKFQPEATSLKKEKSARPRLTDKKFREDDEEYQLSQIDQEISTFSADAEEEEQSFSDMPQRNRRNSSKSRKVRTTITQQKLTQMNKIFKQYKEMRDTGITHKEINLKAICHKLQLGYSTILHKYRQFRNNSEVKGGALLESRELRRKYKKSVEIEQHIKEAMQQRNLTNAVQISKYIYKTKKIYYSRAVICRHLGSMRNPKRVHKHINEQQRQWELKIINEFEDKLLDYKHEDRSIGEMFNSIVQLWSRNNGKIAYFHQVVYERQLRENQNSDKKLQNLPISLYLLVFQNKIALHKLKNGIFQNQDYLSFLTSIGQWKAKSTPPLKGELLLLTNPNQIHYDSCESIEPLLQKYKLRKTLTPLQFKNPLYEMLVDLKQRIIEREKETKHRFLIENLVMSWRGSRLFKFAL